MRPATTAPGHKMEPSASVRAARDFIRENVAALAAVALHVLDHLEHLPSDDFFVAQTVGLGDQLAVFLEEWTYEDTANPSVQIFPFGPRRLVIPWAATAAAKLYLAGHRSVGIGLINPEGRGKLFRYTSFDDVQSREIVGTLSSGVLQ